MNTMPKEALDPSVPNNANNDSARVERGLLFGALVAIVFALVWHSVISGPLSTLLLSAALVTFGFVLAPEIPTIRVARPLTGTTFAQTLSNWPFLVALLAVGLGGAIRFYGLDFDFPLFYHPDEARKSRVILRMMENHSLDPGYFLHPSMLLYSGYFFAKVLAHLGVEYQKDALQVVLGGRFASAALGTVSIALVYALGARLFSRSSGAIAALLLAASPLHVTCSRYMKEDVIFLTFGLLTAYFVARALDTRNRRWLLAAGVGAGLSLSSKYTGVLFTSFIMAEPFFSARSLRPKRSDFQMVFAACVLVAVSYLVTSPYSLLNFQKFFHDFTSEGRHIYRGHGGISIPPWGQLWMYHMERSVLPALTSVPVFVGLLGGGLLAYRKRWQDLYVLYGFLLFYVAAEFIKAKPMPQPDRYILPVVPFLCLAAGEFLSSVQQKLTGNHARIALCLVALTIALPVSQSVGLASELYDDTRLQASRWVLQHAQKRARILMIGEVKYLPRLPKKKYRVGVMGAERGRERIATAKIDASENNFLVVTSLSYDRFLKQPNADPILREVFKEYDRKYPILAEISPRFGTYGFHNPTIKIYELKPQPKLP